MSETTKLDPTVLKVAIVGAGPAGFYAAVELLREPSCSVMVDMFDRLPTPFGLVRNGVAPDHENIRAVTRFYTTGAEARPSRFRLFGNVEIGKDLRLSDLRDRYHAVILAVGAQSDRRLGIAGEELRGVHPASAFVSWYNAHPDFAEARFDLSAQRVVVIGHGNVALDVCRMLCRTPQELAHTDTSRLALEQLSRSRVQDIVLLGRSGPAQSSFTPTELKELTQLAGTDLVVTAEDRVIDPITQQKYDSESLDPLRARNLQIVLQDTRAEPRGGNKVIRLRFYSSPIEVLGDGVKVTGVRIRRNRLVDQQGALTLEPTDRVEQLPCELVFRSIGYRVVPIDGVPFELDKDKIPNDRGQVLVSSSGPGVPGLFVTGWAKRGPSGIIGTNKPDALETVTLLVDAWRADKLPCLPVGIKVPDIAALLQTRGVQFTTYSDWKLLDQMEIQSGRAEGRPRRKFADVPSMLRAIGDARLSTIRDDELIGGGEQDKGEIASVPTNRGHGSGSVGSSISGS